VTPCAPDRLLDAARGRMGRCLVPLVGAWRAG
jgi:hypothetical protein